MFCSLKAALAVVASTFAIGWSDALLALKSATDPDNRIIHLNCGAVATELTNEKCSFWHFRYDINVAEDRIFERCFHQ